MKHFLNLKEEFSKHINVDQMTSLEYYKAKSTLLILSDEYKPVIKKQKRNGYTINFSASLFESQFFSNVKFNSVYSIIIYGSHSTGDNIAFSDIDILVILNDYVAHTKKQLVSDLNKLAIIHKILFKQDPLMHHGLSFENLSNFNLYSEKILPLETIKHSKYLYGSKSLNISLMEEDGTSDLSINRLKYILSELINNYNFNKKKMQFDYYLKYYISGILLIPSLFLQTQNISRLLQMIVLVALLVRVVIKKIELNIPLDVLASYKYYFYFMLFSLFSSVFGVINGAYSIPSLYFTETLLVSVYRPILEYVIAVYYFLYFVVLARYMIDRPIVLDYFFKIFSGLFYFSLIVGLSDMLLMLMFPEYHGIPRHISDMRAVGFRFHGVAGEPRDAFVYLILGVCMLWLKDLWRGQKRLTSNKILIIFFSVLL